MSNSVSIHTINREVNHKIYKILTNTSITKNAARYDVRAIHMLTNR